MSDPPLDYALNLKIDSICRQKLKSKLSKTETIYYRKKRSYALNGLGMNLNNQGEQAKAIQFYTESLKIAEELGLKSSTGAILMNMAVLYKDRENYTQSLIHLKRCLSIFTDWLQDQFGGEKGKKFKASKLKELLLSIQDKSMQEQKNIIEASFEKWKGNLEQNDDVCIIGVRV